MTSGILMAFYTKDMDIEQYDAPSNNNVKLSSVLQNKSWIWKPARSDDRVMIQSKLPSVEIGDTDKIIRLPSKSGSYSSAKAWE